MEKDPTTIAQDDKQACVQKIVDARQDQGRDRTSTSSVQLEHEWKYFARAEGSYIEQEIFTTTPDVHRHGAQGRRDADADLLGHRR